MALTKLLLVGPYPPPHGGVSVHVAGAYRILRNAGLTCGVLNVEPRAPVHPAYIKISNGLDFSYQLLRHAWNGWMLHVHTNGHNAKSWSIALACGVAARNGVGGVLTLHSGLLPQFLRTDERRRTLARLACLQYDRVVCVNREIAAVIGGLGIPRPRIEVMPAFLPPERPSAVLPAPAERWICERRPLISTALFFRPEYGFEVLVDAVRRLRKRFPRCGCIVMGSGENRMAAEVLLQERGLTDAMRLEGDVDHETCLALMARSAVFVRPTFNDGDSISVREALALGVPVVASATGTRPAGVRLFSPGDSEELAAQIADALDSGAASMGNGGADSARRLLEIVNEVRCRGVI